MQVRQTDQDLLDQARVVVRQRISSDIDRASIPVKLLVARIAEHLLPAGAHHLFGADFGVTKLKEVCRPGKATLEDFESELGLGVKTYIRSCKLEAAKSLLRYRDLRIWRIAFFAGYSGLQPFWRAFKQYTGESPEEYRNREEPLIRRLVPADEMNSDAFWVKATVDDVAPEQAAGLRERLREVASGGGGSGATERWPTLMFTIKDMDETGAQQVAQAIWETLNAYPREAHGLWVRHVIRIDSPAFFHLLGEKSRELARSDAQRGLEVAELAREHLDGNAEALGADVENLRALAWAWVGNARRLADDFPGSERAFAQARELWRVAGEDAGIEAELCDLEATLRLLQQRHAEALALLDRAISITRAQACSRLHASCLLQRVAALAYTGDRNGSIEELHQATSVLEELDRPCLQLTAHALLAGTLALAGRYQEALVALPQARQLCEELDDRLVWHQLQWTEAIANDGLGQCEAAEGLFRHARAGFIELRKPGYAAKVSLDLAILIHRQGRSAETLRLASDAIPILEAYRLRTDVLAVLDILRSAIGASNVPLELLQQVRECLNIILEDPTGSWPVVLSEKRAG